MSITADQAVYRIRRFYRNGDTPRKYQGTFEISDDNTRQVMAACDLTGQAVFATLSIIDHEQKTWQMKPNRKIMPTRWVVTDPDRQVAMQFDQKALGKLVNPLYKTFLCLQDSQGKERYRVVDPRVNIPDRIMGVGPDDWAIMRGEYHVASIVRLSRQKESGKGFFRKLKNILAGSDRGIVSTGSSHVLPPAIALGMIMLFKELTDTSAAG